MPDPAGAGPRFELRTLGRLELLQGGQPVAGQRRKELALLVYLARQDGGRVDRATAASLLWGDRDDQRARTSLRQAIFELKHILGDHLESTPSDIRLVEGTVLLDVAEFEREIASGKLVAAAARPTGDFLAGLEEVGDERWRRWVGEERAGIRARLQSILEQLTRQAEAAGDADRTIQWLQRRLELTPHDEVLAAHLLRSLQASGRSVDAADLAARFRKRLADDLNQEPGTDLRDIMSAPGQGRHGRPMLRGLLSPDLVGREPVAAVVRQTWQEVVAGGGGRVVVLEGGLGSGKSRLLSELEQLLCREAAGAVVASTRAFPSERATPWSAVRPCLAAMARTAAGMAGAPPESLAAAAGVIPELAERFPGRAHLGADVDSAAAIARVVAEAASEQPVAFLVDDVGDADGHSMRLLGELIRRPPPGFLLVLAARPAQWAAHPLGTDLLHPTGQVQRLALSTLTVEQLKRLAQSMAPFDLRSLERLAEVLSEVTGGVPAQAVAAIEALAETGTLAPGTRGSWEIHGNLGVPQAAAALSAHARRLLEMLQPDERRLLELAAVAGPVVDTNLLETLSALPEAAFQEALGGLLAGRQLRAIRGSLDRVEFASEAMQIAVYAALAPSARRRVHGRVARILAEWQGDAGELRRHRQLSRRAGAAVRWGRRLVAVGVAGAAWVAWSSAMPRAPQPPATGVLLATADNATADTTWTGLLPVLAQATLQRTGHLWIATPQQVREALQRMGAPPGAPLQGELAREVALRENLPVVVAVQLADAGGQLLLTMQAVAAADGRTLAAETRQARTGEELVDAVRILADRLRKSLGDKAVGLPDSLPPVTTRSLAALRWFVQGNRSWDEGDRTTAATYWRRAVAADTTFGLAHLALARHAVFPGNDRVAALEHLAAAGRHAQRMTDRERLEVTASTARLMGQSEIAVRAAAELAARFPSPTSIGNYATELFRAGRCQEAVPAFRKAAAMRPTWTAPYVNMAACLQLLDSAAAAVDAYLAADRNDPEVLYRDNLNQEWGRALWAAGRGTAADSVFRIMSASSNAQNRARGLRSRAYLAMSQFRFRDAIALLDLSTAEYRAQKTPPLSEFRNTLLAAECHAALGDASGAAERIRSAERLGMEVRDGPAMWRNAVFAALMAGRPESARWALARLSETQIIGNSADSAHSRLARAALALQEGRTGEAEELLHPMLPLTALELEGVRAQLQGRVFQATGRSRLAIAAFERAMHHRTWGFELQAFWELTPLLLAEAAISAGDIGLAQTSLRDFVRQRAQGDSTAIDLIRARRLLAETGATTVP